MKMMEKKDYIISRENYKKEENSFWETVFSLSNGYIGVRNTVEFGENSRPGIFIIEIYGFGISVPKQILNIPNWLDNRITIGNEQINLDYVKMRAFKQELDMTSGCICTHYEFEHKNGRITQICREEFLVASRKNLYAERVRITPVNYSDSICVDCMLTDVGNAYHGGYQGEFVRTYHWNCLEERHTVDHLEVSYAAVDSECKIRINSSIGFDNIPQLEFGEVHSIRKTGNRYEYHAEEGCSNSIIRLTSISVGHGEVLEDACVNASSEEFDALLNVNRKIWKDKWEKLNFEFEGSDKIKQGLIFSLFQMLQYSAAKESVINVPARGLSSYYHSGHFFFNTDLYLVPYYCWFNPEMARNLIMYRVNTVGQARKNAEDLGCKGVFWSEESDPDGQPAGATKLSDYKNGVHFEEYTGRQVKHLACDVVYSIYYYMEHVHDEAFMNSEIISIVVDAARFYCEYLQLSDSGYYEMRGIMGIDEYHMSINNSFYTMRMVEWLLQYSIHEFETKKEIMYQIGVEDDEVRRWKEVLAKLKPATVTDHVFEQFDGFFELKPVKINQWFDNGLPYIDEKLREELFHMESFDTQLIKQCDVIMLLSMFTDKYTKEQLLSNFMYYDPKTIHESSLSATHAGMIAYLIDRVSDGDRYLSISSRFNLDFAPREDYNNGIHVAANAGAWLMILQGLLGMYVKEETLCFDPHNSDVIQKLKFRFFFRGSELEVYKDSNDLSVKVIRFQDNVVNVKIRDKSIKFEKDHLGERSSINE